MAHRRRHWNSRGISLGHYANYPTRTSADDGVVKPANIPMKNYCLLLMTLFSFSGIAFSATTHYVDLNSSNPVAPYTDWSSAATNIQNAVDAATNGDLILVTNGVFNTGQTLVSGAGGLNRLAVTKPVTVQSVNGPAVTVIQGYITNGPSAGRCVDLATNATLSGFSSATTVELYMIFTSNRGRRHFLSVNFSGVGKGAAIVGNGVELCAGRKFGF